MLMRQEEDVVRETKGEECVYVLAAWYPYSAVIPGCC